MTQATNSVFTPFNRLGKVSIAFIGELGAIAIFFIHAFCLIFSLPIPLDIIKTIINRLLADPFGIELEPLPGAGEILTRLAAQGRLTFVTARPVKEPIEAWLVSLLSEVPHEDIRVIATGHHSAKAEVLEELKLKYFVDDHLETCQDLHKRGIRTIVFDQPWNRGHTPFLRIRTWKDLSGIIKMPS